MAYHIQEASTLLSALTVALSNCQAPWPAFVPVQDAHRDAYRGVALSTHGLMHYDVDCVHLSRLPAQLLQV